MRSVFCRVVCVYVSLYFVAQFKFANYRAKKWHTYKWNVEFYVHTHIETLVGVLFHDYVQLRVKEFLIRTKHKSFSLIEMHPAIGDPCWCLMNDDYYFTTVLIWLAVVWNCVLFKKCFVFSTLFYLCIGTSNTTMICLLSLCNYEIYCTCLHSFCFAFQFDHIVQLSIDRWNLRPFVTYFSARKEKKTKLNKMKNWSKPQQSLCGGGGQ